ncbi:acetyl-CoA C-acyltransferase, partial [Pseudomonas sp. GW460-13]
VYMTMLGTAETVAKRYNISRDVCDEYALQSQQRTAIAQRDGLYDTEIVPITVQMSVTDRQTGAITQQTTTLSRDEGNRPDTSLDALSGLQSVMTGGSVTAGNASQLSDGASACVLMERGAAERDGLRPLGV